MTRRNLLIGATAAVALLLALAYGLSPYFAAWGLASALQERDRDQLEHFIDFPSVRENLKADLKVKMLAKMRGDPDLKNNPFAGLGLLLAPAMVDQMVDAVVTPAMIATIAERGGSKMPPPTKPVTGSEPASQAPLQEAKRSKVSFAYKGLDRFYTTLTAADNTTVTFILARQGLFTWRVKRIELPADLFDEPAAIQQTPEPQAESPSEIETEFPPEMTAEAWIPADMPADDRKILLDEARENEMCRGGTGDEAATWAACERRDRLVAELAARGWCYGEGAASGADSVWARCAQATAPL